MPTGTFEGLDKYHPFNSQKEIIMTDFSTHQLVILLPGTKNGFVKPNVSFTGDTTQDALLMAPYLSGKPVTMVEDLTIDIATTTHKVVGLLVYDGAGTSPLDGMGGADQSGVLTYVYGLATVKIPTRVLETTGLVGGAFNVGDSIYASSNGKLTNDPTSAINAIGTVISVKEITTDGMIVQMSI